MRIHPILPLWIMIPFTIGIFLLCFFPKKEIRKTLPIAGILLFLFLLNLRIQFQKDGLDTISNNLDVLFVIDTTISMKAEDGRKTTRFQDVIEDTNYIIEKLGGARFSLVTFDNNPHLAVPFVKDPNIISEGIENTVFLTELYARGSSLNKPLDLMKNLLKEASKKTDRVQIVFFISDGENTSDEKLKSYSELKDNVDFAFVLGYGTNAGGKMKILDYSEEREVYLTYYDSETYREKDAISVMDETSLRQIAKDMGGDYIYMSQKKAVDKALKKIQKGAQEKLDEKSEKGYEDTYYLFLLPLLTILLIEFRKGAH